MFFITNSKPSLYNNANTCNVSICKFKLCEPLFKNTGYCELYLVQCHDAHVNFNLTGQEKPVVTKCD